MTTKIILIQSYLQTSLIQKVNGKQVRIHIRYNCSLDNYYINVDKLVNGAYENVLNSVMLYTGFNLFTQHPQLNLGYLYVVPVKKELYSQEPTPSTIQDYVFLWTYDE